LSNSYELANNFDSYLSVINIINRILNECTMKKTILFLLVTVISVCVQAQSLKDLLYGGKLKNDSNSVVRKTDDLSSKIDTTTKKPEQSKVVETATTSSSTKKSSSQGDLVTIDPAAKDSVAAVATSSNTTATKNNNQILKEYMDSLAATLKTEVLPSKKIKKDIYYMLVEYEIETNGQVNITNVTSTPESDFLQDQVKSRLIVSAPQLNPALDSNNKARKVKRKYTFNITKE
jgi:hypothetical protein